MLHARFKRSRSKSRGQSSGCTISDARNLAGYAKLSLFHFAKLRYLCELCVSAVAVAFVLNPTTTGALMFLGIDVGTGGTRAVLIDRTGQVIAQHSADHAGIHSEHPGWAEQDPEDWFRATILAV